MLPHKKEIGCVCFRIDYNELQRIIRTGNVRDYREFKKLCPAGSACGSCIPYIDIYIKENIGYKK
jgi:bacterioferritin-associated ferredoxin